MQIYNKFEAKGLNQEHKHEPVFIVVGSCIPGIALLLFYKITFIFYFDVGRSQIE